MTDTSRTNQELLEENAFLKQKNKELEQSESERKRVGEALRESEEKYCYKLHSPVLSDIDAINI